MTITAPTSAATFTATASPLALGGTASDNVGVTQVTWSNDRGGSGTAAGTGTWTVGGIPLASGDNVITVTARDAAGNTATDTLTVSYQGAPACIDCSLWDATVTPSLASSPDTGAVNLGVKFRADVAGRVTGVRFYKGTANTGTHVASLWTAGGTLLAQATFTNETASGWQQVNFPSAVAIQANTTYVVSYHAPNGRYAFDGAYFASTSVDAGPLQAPATAAVGGNGVYRYGASSAFPDASYNASSSASTAAVHRAPSRTHLQRQQLLGRRRVHERLSDGRIGCDSSASHDPEEARRVQVPPSDRPAGSEPGREHDQHRSTSS